jgi:multiple sugar transport system ATP-binding protein
MSAVQLINIHKHYRDGKQVTEVIKGVDLTIHEGEFVVFVGPSGCGKSTLLRMIAGLEDITEGQLLLNGKLANDVAPAKRGLAMVFQSYALYPHMSVYENMAFSLKMSGKSKSQIQEAIQKAADVLQISHLLERKPKDLSGGQRQRVAIGRAIVRQPSLFLFDEPLSNLDASLRVQMRIELSRLHQELKTSMIYVTHDQVEAMTLGERIVVFNEGKIEQVGTPLELYEQPKNVFVASFLGSPKMNFLPAQFEENQTQGALFTLKDGTQMLASVDASHLKKGDQVQIACRAEHAQMRGVMQGVMQSETNADKHNVLTVRCQFVEHLGDASIYHAQAIVANEAAYALAIKVMAYQASSNSKTPSQVINKGDAFKMFWPAEHCHVFDENGKALLRLM